MRSEISISLTIAGALLWTGCAANTAKVHFYTIQPSAPAANLSAPDGPTLLVANVATPPDLQDGRIRYRIGSNETGAYEYHRWVERPGMMVHYLLIRALRNSGKYQRVLDAGSAVDGDYLLRTKLNEFGEVDNNASVQTRISLQVELVDRKTNHTVWDRVVEHEEPVSSKDVPNVVQSLDRNLQYVVRDATTEIDKFLATRR